MEKILAEILVADKNILARRDDLISALDEKVPSNLSRDYAPIKKAINLNVGEIFFVNDLDTAKAEAEEILKSSGMQEARINFVIDTFANAIEIQNKKIAEIEAKAEAERIAKQAAENAKKSPQPEPNVPPPPTYPKPPAPIVPPQQNTQSQQNSQVQPQQTYQPQPVQNIPAQPDNTKKILVGVICGLAIALLAVIGNKSSDNNSAQPVQENFQTEVTENNSSSTSQNQRDAVRQTAQNYHNAKTDLSLNGMDLEMSADELENILGTPREYKPVEDHTRYIYSDNFYASVQNGKVIAFVTHDANFKTYRGVHVGSTYSDVATAYGTNSMDMAYDGMMLYEYPFTSQEGNKGLLRFAVKNGIVNYISARITETYSQQPQQNNIDQNTKNAATAFVNYHKAITNKDFYAAFNYFSEDRRRKMKNDVQAFSKGYTETISSEITDLKLVSTSDSVVVMNYILDAKDRRSDGSILYQQFSGQVEMVKEYGDWKISDAHSKKIK